jgi:hypothetical protein
MDGRLGKNYRGCGNAVAAGQGRLREGGRTTHAREAARRGGGRRPGRWAPGRGEGEHAWASAAAAAGHGAGRARCALGRGTKVGGARDCWAARLGAPAGPKGRGGKGSRATLLFSFISRIVFPFLLFTPFDSNPNMS